MKQRKTAPPLSGRALRTAVRAAENPVTSTAVKATFVKQHGIDALFELDLRNIDAAPASLPTHAKSRGSK